MGFKSDKTYGDNFEGLFGKILEEASVPYAKLPEFERFDFKVLNSYVELKNRKCNHDTYKTTIVNLGKYIYALECIKKNSKAFLLLQFNDWIYYYNLQNPPSKIQFQTGRYDRWRDEDNWYVHFDKTKLIQTTLQDFVHLL
jgi:hypothetical protein